VAGNTVILVARGGERINFRFESFTIACFYLNILNPYLNFKFTPP
jgi:hypothetical protein